MKAPIKRDKKVKIEKPNLPDDQNEKVREKVIEKVVEKVIEKAQSKKMVTPLPVKRKGIR
jgi:hypothetical protein